MKNIIYALSFCVLVVSGISQSFAAIEISTPATHAIIMDAQTGEILMAKNAEDKMPTSSMSKAMTIYAVFKALKENRMTLKDTMRVSEKAWAKGGSKMFLEIGQDVTIDDLIKGVLVQSGNDATIVLSEGLADSEDIFALSITQMAKDLGMKNTNFVNASGWPDPNHYSTAQDLAILAQRLIKDFPEYYYYFSIKDFTFNKIKQSNRNPLLYRNMGVDGLKTGHTEAGGYGLMASGERDGRRLILIVNGLADKKMRGSESARLLEWGFSSFGRETLFKADEKVADVDVILGQQAKLPVTVKSDVAVSIYKPRKEELDVKVTYDDPLYAPIEKGASVGTLHVTVPGGQSYKFDLIAQQGVRKVGLVQEVISKIKYMILGQF